jgi:hypothetical protein
LWGELNKYCKIQGVDAFEFKELTAKLFREFAEGVNAGKGSGEKERYGGMVRSQISHAVRSQSRKGFNRRIKKPSERAENMRQRFAQGEDISRTER